jgi:uncharacterized protein (TIGR03086 family)
MVRDLIERHGRACAGFTAVVDHPGAVWDAPSPCAEWSARGVVEHVIGFHEVLLLRPLGVKVVRPKHDVPQRWALTRDAVLGALADGSVMARDLTALPGAEEFNVATLLPVLTTEVLVHTWDLARAFALDVELDADLVARAEAFARGLDPSLRGDSFAPAVAVSEDADRQSRMLAWFGRAPR